MRLRKPDPEQSFVLALVVGGVFGVAFIGYTTVDGVRTWVAARHYPLGSICARQQLVRMDVDIAMVSAGTTRPGDKMEDRKKQQGEQGARIAEAERAPAEAFFGVLEAVEKAKPAGIAAPNTLCMPEHMIDQWEAIYAACAADLAGRLKAHPATCNANADADAMKWIVGRFPCGRTYQISKPHLGFASHSGHPGKAVVAHVGARSERPADRRWAGDATAIVGELYRLGRRLVLTMELIRELDTETS